MATTALARPLPPPLPKEADVLNTHYFIVGVILLPNNLSVHNYEKLIIYCKFSFLDLGNATFPGLLRPKVCSKCYCRIQAHKIIPKMKW